jgi:hypothetical protein
VHMIDIKAGHIFKLAEIYKQIGTLTGALAIAPKPGDAYRPIHSGMMLAENYGVRYVDENGTVIAQPYVGECCQDENMIQFSCKSLSSFTPIGHDTALRNRGNSLALKVKAARIETPKDAHVLAAALLSQYAEIKGGIAEPVSAPQPGVTRPTAATGRIGGPAGDMIL